MKTKTDYNGWKNRQTWNVALHISNDYNLYQSAIYFVKSNQKCKKIYASFIYWAGLRSDRTPDNIKWISDALHYKELNRFMLDLIN